MGLDSYLRLVLALAAVLLLIAGVSWLARRFGLAGTAGGRGGRRRRLSIVEVLALDNRRRLVLVRRDDREHLLLIGGGSDLIVEPAILPGMPPAAADGAKTAT